LNSFPNLGTRNPKALAAGGVGNRREKEAQAPGLFFFCFPFARGSKKAGRGGSLKKPGLPPKASVFPPKPAKNTG